MDNKRSDYAMLSRLVKWMRIDDMLPWRLLEDRSRTVTAKRGDEDVRGFIDREVDSLLTGYNRCLVQGQTNYVEVWTEKDALFRIFQDVVFPYCIRTVVRRGYSSVTFIADFYNRAQDALMKGQRPIILYFGDLDPSGVQMLEATKETLEDEFELFGVDFKRVALNPQHVHHYNLPHDPMAAKTSDPRYQSYAQRYGNLAVELDALHPADLEALIREAIEVEIDMERFREEQGREEEDIERVEALRERVMEMMAQEGIVFD